ncbi:MAG: aldo/keto reductase [Bdellovibrio sp.]|nr:aldo/keto reductase [Bdellovibrio sp.]
MSIKSQEHEEALRLALDLGCNLIDTSTNYTYGDSELLIGKVLADYKGPRPTIISKAGYIQGPNLKQYEELRSNGKAKEDLVDLGQDFKHSIHPEFLENQITLSLARLGAQDIDFFLLHNPENYFKTKGPSEEIYLQRLKKAFMHLEEEVFRGRIKYYGISSNTFPSNPTDSNYSNLEKILSVAKSVARNHHFKMIQFPMNLIERGALGQRFGEKNLIQFAKINNLVTMANRPLNAFAPDGFLRLAQYVSMIPTLHECGEMLSERLEMLQRIVDQRHVEEHINIHELPFIKQFKEIWATLPTPDVVEQVFICNFFPLIAQLYGSALSLEESKPYYMLYDIALSRSRQLMTERASKYRVKLEDEGIIVPHANQPLPVLAIQKYLEWGVDHVLVGMKRPQYVRELQAFFPAN